MTIMDIGRAESSTSDLAIIGIIPGAFITGIIATGGKAADELID